MFQINNSILFIRNIITNEIIYTESVHSTNLINIFKSSNCIWSASPNQSLLSIIYWDIQDINSNIIKFIRSIRIYDNLYIGMEHRNELKGTVIICDFDKYYDIFNKWMFMDKYKNNNFIIYSKDPLVLSPSYISLDNMFIADKGVKHIRKTTDKELREAHDIPKLYIAKSFFDGENK